MNNTNQPYVATIDRFSSTPNFACETHVVWSAILMGALAAIGLSFLLNLFSIAIGLTAVATNSTGNGTLALGSFLGLLIGSIACMFFSGWLAGYIARPSYKKINVGGVYGFAAWCLALLITILTASSVGKFIAGSANSLANPAAFSEMRVNQPDNLTAVTISSATHDQINNPTKSLNAASVGAFLIFILFFVGALSSTIGGYCAGSIKNKDDR